MLTRAEREQRREAGRRCAEVRRQKLGPDVFVSYMNTIANQPPQPGSRRRGRPTWQEALARDNESIGPTGQQNTEVIDGAGVRPPSHSQNL